MFHSREKLFTYLLLLRCFLNEEQTEREIVNVMGGEGWDGGESLSLPLGPGRSSNTTPHRQKCVFHDSVGNNTRHCNQVYVMHKVADWSPGYPRYYIKVPITLYCIGAWVFLNNTHIINKTSTWKNWKWTEMFQTNETVAVAFIMAMDVLFKTEVIVVV